MISLMEKRGSNHQQYMSTNTTNSTISTHDLPTPSLKRRLICMIYEGLLVFGVIFFSAFVFDVATQSRHALVLRHAREAFLFVVIGAYFIFFWRRGGQTLAMQTWRIRLIGTRSDAVSFKNAAIRYCLAWMWFLPGLLVAKQLGLKNAQLLIPIAIGFCLWGAGIWFSKDRQFLHDVVARTRLVQLPKPTPQNKEPGEANAGSKN